MLIHIPLNLYNICAITLLFFVTRYLGTLFKLSHGYATVFAVSVCTLNVIVRWINAQTVDIWLASFYLLSLALLIKPKNSWWYYLGLGTLAGFLIGTKYSGPLFVLILFIVYAKNFIKYINFKRLIIFIVPILLFGIFWYVRNYIATANPFYPLDTPLFKGLKGNPIIEVQVWKTFLQYPKEMFDAFLGEFMLWALLLLTLPLFLLYCLYKKRVNILTLLRPLLLLALLNFIIFLILPSGTSYQLHVSQYRFSYVVFIPLILCMFLLAQKYHKEEGLAFLSIASMFTLPSLSYHPKLLFFYLPLVYILVFTDAWRFIKKCTIQIINNVFTR